MTAEEVSERPTHIALMVMNTDGWQELDYGRFPLDKDDDHYIEFVAQSSLQVRDLGLAYYAREDAVDPLTIVPLHDTLTIGDHIAPESAIVVFEPLYRFYAARAKASGPPRTISARSRRS